MAVRRHVRPDIFGAVLPLVLGVAVLALERDGGYVKAVTGWVADGFLMPPATVLWFSLYRLLSEVPEGRARSTAEALAIVSGLVSALIFSASVNPDPDSSTTGMAVVNLAMYVWVVVCCATVAKLPRDADQGTG